jgi:metal-sulfur cluster biosynthetic enzyme
MITEEDVYLAISDVYDPEIRTNIVDLGLIYDVKVSGPEVQIKMTLTSPNCPASPEIRNNVIKVTRALKGVEKVDLELVWEPTWDESRLSEAARLELGLDLSEANCR